VAQSVCMSPLLLLAPRVTDDSVAVWQAALAAGWSTRRLANWRVPAELIATDREITIYAEPLFAEAIADQLEMALLEPPANWLTVLPKALLRRDVGVMPLSEARKISTPAFVKPAEGKVFDATVYRSGDSLPNVDQIGDISVLTSTPVSFSLEVRCFVLEGQVVTMSPYWRNGSLARAEDGSWPFWESEEEGAVRFAASVLNAPEVSFPPAFVLDVGLMEYGWAVIEANPCWGAGLYGCDPSLVLQTGRYAIRRRREMNAGDMQWVTKRNSSGRP